MRTTAASGRIGWLPVADGRHTRSRGQDCRPYDGESSLATSGRQSPPTPGHEPHDREFQASPAAAPASDPGDSRVGFGLGGNCRRRRLVHGFRNPAIRSLLPATRFRGHMLRGMDSRLRGNDGFVRRFPLSAPRSPLPAFAGTCFAGMSLAGTDPTRMTGSGVPCMFRHSRASGNPHAPVLARHRPCRCRAREPVDHIRLSTEIMARPRPSTDVDSRYPLSQAHTSRAHASWIPPPGLLPAGTGSAEAGGTTAGSRGRAPIPDHALACHENRQPRAVRHQSRERQGASASIARSG